MLTALILWLQNTVPAVGFLVPALFFAAGIVLVIKGGDWFVDAAGAIAKMLGVPTFIIGATIVSLATTLPEMIVSVTAAAQSRTSLDAQGSIDMAIGNAVGSVTANTALIMALAFVFLKVVISRREYIAQSLLLIGAATVLWLGSLSGQLEFYASGILVCIFIAFMTLNVVNGKRAALPAEEKGVFTGRDVGKNVFLFILGADAIVGGSQLLVSGGGALAAALGVPERIIAVTLVAVGTSLPELVTTLTAIRKKESALSVGNIIGANVIDLSLILPICSLVSGQRLPVTPISITLDFPVCLGVILIAVLPLLIRQKASRAQGVLLLAVYAGYLALTVVPGV
ncbi:MAG: calcium/sodium antiporter [Clostridia bacterium]|nr:calcium/sodium antiporter [Clostridia bacterium]